MFYVNSGRTVTCFKSQELAVYIEAVQSAVTQEDKAIIIFKPVLKGFPERLGETCFYG